MNELYSIGEVSKMTGVSIDTLRYYDSIGLLHPNYINEDSHYRYYDVNQFWRIEVIRTLRSVDISIEDIRELITLNDDKLVIEKISQCLIETEEKLKHYKKMVNELKWFKKQCIKMYEPIPCGIYEKEIDERIVAYNSLTASSKKNVHIWSQKDVGIDNGKDTIKKIYGFSLDKESLYLNEYYRTGEYIYYPDNKNLCIPIDMIKVLPHGVYICKTAKVTRIQGDQNQRGHIDASDLIEYIKSKGYVPQIILAQEVGIPLLNFQEINYEIQILVS